MRTMLRVFALAVAVVLLKPTYADVLVVQPGYGQPGQKGVQPAQLQQKQQSQPNKQQQQPLVQQKQQYAPSQQQQQPQLQQKQQHPSSQQQQQPQLQQKQQYPTSQQQQQPQLQQKQQYPTSQQQQQPQLQQKQQYPTSQQQQQPQLQQRQPYPSSQQQQQYLQQQQQNPSSQLQQQPQLQQQQQYPISQQQQQYLQQQQQYPSSQLQQQYLQQQRQYLSSQQQQPQSMQQQPQHQQFQQQPYLQQQNQQNQQTQGKDGERVGTFLPLPGGGFGGGKIFGLGPLGLYGAKMGGFGALPLLLASNPQSNLMAHPQYQRSTNEQEEDQEDSSELMMPNSAITSPESNPTQNDNTNGKIGASRNDNAKSSLLDPLGLMDKAGEMIDDLKSGHMPSLLGPGREQNIFNPLPTSQYTQQANPKSMGPAQQRSSYVSSPTYGQQPQQNGQYRTWPSQSQYGMYGSTPSYGQTPYPYRQSSTNGQNGASMVGASYPQGQNTMNQVGARYPGYPSYSSNGYTAARPSNQMYNQQYQNQMTSAANPILGSNSAYRNSAYRNFGTSAMSMYPGSTLYPMNYAGAGGFNSNYGVRQSNTPRFGDLLFDGGHHLDEEVVVTDYGHGHPIIPIGGGIINGGYGGYGGYGNGYGGGYGGLYDGGYPHTHITTHHHGHLI